MSGFRTNTEHVDSRLEQTVEVFREHFEPRLQAIYLSGSWREGTAVKGSDLDLILVLGGSASRDDRRKLAILVATLNEHATPEIGPLLVDDAILSRPLPMYLKAAALLWGEDVFEDATEMSAVDTQRRWTHGSLRLLKMLEHPNGGYDLGTSDEPRLKLFVSAVARMAGARAAARGVCLASKSACCLQYRDIVGGEDTDTVEEVYRVCKIDWGYAWPTTPEGEARIPHLQEAVSAMEQRFRAEVARWVLQAKDTQTPEAMEWARQCNEYLAQ